MGFFSRQLLKVIQWKDDTNNVIVHRYKMDTRDEIMNGCQLVVNESQIAILSKEGQFADVFGPGTHRLETKNIPVLTKIAGWKYGFDSPFKCDVYYINTKQFINQNWGTANPVMMRDVEFGMIRVRAFGKYSFQVDDAQLLIRQLVGTNADYTVNDLKEHLKSMFVSSFSDALATAKIPALDIAMKYDELANVLKDVLVEKFKSFGLKPIQVYVENVSLPEEVEKVIDKRTSLGVLEGKMGSYAAMESIGAMRDAANNPNGSGLAGAGVGLGAGVTMGSAMMDSLKDIKDEPKQSLVNCPNCNNSVPSSSKFCPECGKQLSTTKFCPECGAKVSSTSKFCNECGHKLN